VEVIKHNIRERGLTITTFSFRELHINERGGTGPIPQWRGLGGGECVHKSMGWYKKKMKDLSHSMYSGTLKSAFGSGLG